MKKLSLVFMALFLLACFSIAQQQQYGNIRGTVVEGSGAPLPGVAVTLEGPQATRSLATTESGIFRFINLIPGTYKLRAEIAGFNPFVQENIIVQAGTNIDLEVKLEIKSLDEEVTVVAVTPVVDSKKTSVGTNVTKELLIDLPSARDPWVLMAQQPGTVAGSENVGGSESGMQSGLGGARGATDGSGIYNVDGVVLTDGGGGSPSYYDYDAMEEIQISTAGNDASIQTGGTSINFIKKRGTNKFTAEFHVYYTNDKLQGTNATPEVIASGFKGDLIRNIADYGFQLGGPLIKDKMWIWAGGAQQDIKKWSIQHFQNNTILNITNMRLNWQVSRNNRFEFGWDYDEKIVDGRGASRTIPRESSLLQSGPARHFKFEDEHTFSDNFLMVAKVSLFPSWWSTTPIGGLDKQYGQDQITKIYRDSYYEGWNGVSSYGGRIDTNLFVENILGGDHEFKSGVEVRYLPFEYRRTDGGGVLRYFRYDEPYSARVYRQRIDKYSNLRYSGYLQDTYTRNRLTFNLGLRLDVETGWVRPSAIPAAILAPELMPALSAPKIDPGVTWWTLSPRFGVTYDLFNNRKTILKANIAQYGTTMYSDFATQLSVVNTSYATFYWNDMNKDLFVTQNELVGYPNNFINTSGFDPENPTSLSSPNQIDPNVTSVKTQEIIAGVEHELITDFAVGVNLFLRKNFNFLWYPYVGESRSDYVGPYSGTDSGYNYEYWTATTQRNAGTILTNNPKHYQVFRGLELVFNKRMSHNWMVTGSMTLQSTKDKYPEGSYYDPTNIELSNNGELASAKWMAKLSWVYQFPLGIMFSGYSNIRQGKAFNPVLSVETPERGDVGLEDSMDLYIETIGTSRYKTFYNMDLRLGKDFQLGSAGKLSLSVDFFNVFNFNHELLRTATVNSSSYKAIEEILKPRLIRFSVRFKY